MFVLTGEWDGWGGTIKRDARLRTVHNRLKNTSKRIMEAKCFFENASNTFGSDAWSGKTINEAVFSLKEGLCVPDDKTVRDITSEYYSPVGIKFELYQFLALSDRRVAARRHACNCASCVHNICSGVDELNLKIAANGCLCPNMKWTEHSVARKDDAGVALLRGLAQEHGREMAVKVVVDEFFAVEARNTGKRGDRFWMCRGRAYEGKATPCGDTITDRRTEIGHTLFTEGDIPVAVTFFERDSSDTHGMTFISGKDGVVNAGEIRMVNIDLELEADPFALDPSKVMKLSAAPTIIVGSPVLARYDLENRSGESEPSMIAAEVKSISYSDDDGKVSGYSIQFYDEDEPCERSVDEVEALGAGLLGRIVFGDRHMKTQEYEVHIRSVEAAPGTCSVDITFLEDGIMRSGVSLEKYMLRTRLAVPVTRREHSKLGDFVVGAQVALSKAYSDIAAVRGELPYWYGVVMSIVDVAATGRSAKIQLASCQEDRLVTIPLSSPHLSMREEVDCKFEISDDDMFNRGGVLNPRTATSTWKLSFADKEEIHSKLWSKQA